MDTIAAECGLEFEYRWLEVPTTQPFALELDAYLQELTALPVECGDE